MVPTGSCLTATYVEDCLDLQLAPYMDMVSINQGRQTSGDLYLFSVQFVLNCRNCDVQIVCANFHQAMFWYTVAFLRFGHELVVVSLCGFVIPEISKNMCNMY